MDTSTQAQPTQFKSLRVILTLLLLGCFSALGCANALKQNTSAETDEDLDSHEVQDSENEINELRSQIKTLTQKITTLETQLSELSNKQPSPSITPTASPIPSSSPNEMVKTEPFPTFKIGTPGVPISTKLAPTDPEDGFIQDDAVLSYRKAMILFRSQNYSEAIVSFSTFLEKYIDHAFAGSAQFHIGESYLKEKEYKLAAQEFERVLTSFDRSPYVSGALARLTELYEKELKNPEQAKRYRQSLTSNFPQSPYATPYLNGTPISTPEPKKQSESPSSVPADFPVDTAPLPIEENS